MKIISSPWGIIQLLEGGGHNILEARASRRFSAVQKSIQQYPRSAAMLDSHDL